MTNTDIDSNLSDKIKLSPLSDRPLSKEEVSSLLSKKDVNQTKNISETYEEFSTIGFDKLAPKVEVLKQAIPESININSKRQNRFHSVQKWEGNVIELIKNGFIARVKDSVVGGTDEEAEFSFEDIPEDDIELVKEGAIFYWNIGYEENMGTRKKASIVKFRRLAPWPKQYIEKVKANSSNIRNRFNWE